MCKVRALYVLLQLAFCHVTYSSLGGVNYADKEPVEADIRPHHQTDDFWRRLEMTDAGFQHKVRVKRLAALMHRKTPAEIAEENKEASIRGPQHHMLTLQLTTPSSENGNHEAPQSGKQQDNEFVPNNQTAYFYNDLKDEWEKMGDILDKIADESDSGPKEHAQNGNNGENNQKTRKNSQTLSTETNSINDDTESVRMSLNGKKELEVIGQRNSSDWPALQIPKHVFRRGKNNNPKRHKNRKQRSRLGSVL